MAAPVVTSARASSSLSQSEEDALKVAVFQRLHPRAYLERFLAEDIRPDKRLCDGFRDVHVNVGKFFNRISPLFLKSSNDVLRCMRRLGSISTANGSAVVRMGNTTIVCGVKAEISEPELDRDGDGFLGIQILLHHLLSLLTCDKKIVPNLDLPAMCSPTFKLGPPTEKAQVLSDRLNQVLTMSVIFKAPSPNELFNDRIAIIIIFILFFQTVCLILYPNLDPIYSLYLLSAFTEESQFGSFTSMPRVSTTTATRLTLHFLQW